MGKRKERKVTRRMKIERSEEKERHDPRKGIYVTYEMMGPDTKAVIDRMFRDRSRAEYIANL